MRRPTVADVLEAVTYVKGWDPLTAGRGRSVVATRRLAIHSLREITDLSWPEVAHALGYAQPSTPMRMFSTPVDYDELRAVAARISDRLELAEALEAW